MKLKVCSENNVTYLDLDDKATKQLFVTLSIVEDPDATKEENEKRLKEEFDVQFNRPDYNNWHKETRHIDPTPKVRRLDGMKGYITPEPGDTSFDPMENLAVTHDEYDADKYEETCRRVRAAFPNKPDWVDIVIEVCINQMPVKEYARLHHMSESSVSHKYARALKKLRKIFEKTSD
jgi:hypothetical protein